MQSNYNNTSAPLVTIVITAYNQAIFLDESIQSVLNQDYRNIELIVLDDGSSDNTQDVLRKYNGRFYWESHSNMGQAATINKGWGMSKGSIISYLSSDDFLASNAVSKAVDVLHKESEASMTFCNFYIVDEQSNILSERVAPDFNYEQLVSQLVCMPGPGVFIKKTAYEQAGGWDPEFRQMPDYEYWLRLSLIGPFMKINDFLACYRVHAESQSYTVSDTGKSEEPIRAIKKYFDRDDIPPKILHSRNVAFSNAHLISARLHIRSGRYGLGLQRLLAAISYSPAQLISLRSTRIVLNAFRYSMMRSITKIFQYNH